MNFEAIIVAAVMSAGAVLRELSFRREKRRLARGEADRMDSEVKKLDADAASATATAADTISAAFLGLLTVMEKKLETAERDLDVAQTSLRQVRQQFDAVRQELANEKARNSELEDEIAQLTMRLFEAEQQESP